MVHIYRPRSRLTVRSDEDIDPNMFDQPGSYPMGIDTFDQGISPVDPANVWQNMGPPKTDVNIARRFGVQSAPKSAQSKIVNSRPHHVSQQFGQITPPGENSLENDDVRPSKLAGDAQRSETEDIAKLNRAQRARNAANKRHAKSKKARKDIGGNEGSDGAEDEDGQGKSTSLQREKNRVAAAKCRAKKKATSEVMQDTHREGARMNSYLQREMRELRDQKAFLRNTLLQHEAGMCKCHAIHQYNMAQAHQLAFGVGSMGGQPISPSLDSVSSAQTPGSDTFSIAGPSLTTGRPKVALKLQSFSSSSSPGLEQDLVPDNMSRQQGNSQDLSQMPQQFSEFLRDSPVGRAGFS